MVVRRCFSFLAVSAIGLVSACTLLYGPSSDELTGGTPNEASASSTSGTLPDGAPVTSSSSSSSSASSSSSSGADGGPFVCPSGALACEDFELAAPKFPTKQGTIDVVAGGHDSAKSLEAVVLKNQPSPSLSVELAVPTHGATLSFWFKPDGPPPDPSITFRIVHALWGDACDWRLSWTVFMTKDGLVTGTDTYDAKVQPSCGPVDFQSKQLLPASKIYDGQWHRLSVTMDASTKTRKTSTQIDAEPAIESTVTSGRSDLPTTVNFGLGIPCVQEGGGGGCLEWSGNATYRIRFDDVALTPAP